MRKVFKTVARVGYPSFTLIRRNVANCCLNESDGDRINCLKYFIMPFEIVFYTAEKFFYWT